MKKYSMRKKIGILCLFILISMGCTGKREEKKGPDNQATFSLFAAAGMRPVAEKLCAEFEKNHQCIVTQNYSASGTLARQIVQGAQADLFISANKQWIDFLAEKKILDPLQIKVLASTELVLVTPKNYGGLVPQFHQSYAVGNLKSTTIVIGDPAYVPVGRYAKEVFDTLRWTGTIMKQAILARDVASVLRLVELGEADWGLVYYSQARMSDNCTIQARVPGSLHTPIQFYGAVLKKENIEAMQLLNLFLSDAASEYYRASGFTPAKDSIS